MSYTVNANGKRPHVEDNDDQEEAVRDAEAPFNQPTADFILRSADRMDFHVHKVVLSLASPVFETMLSLPKTRSISASQEKKCGLPVITLPESSLVVDTLLRFCYPAPAPIVTHFTHASRLYEAVDKYAMDALMEPAVDVLVKTVSQQPLAAYALGCRHRVDALIVAAAKETLKTPIKDLKYCPELEHITGGDLFRLIRYHEECRMVARRRAIKDQSWIPHLSDVPLGASKQECTKCCGSLSIYKRSYVFPGIVYDPIGALDRWVYWGPDWWWDYLERAEKALKIRPRGDTVKSKEVLGPALIDAVECDETTACRGGTKALMDFSELFAKAVEDALDKVIPFFHP